MEEKIKTLITSNSREDRIIGFTLLKQNIEDIRAFISSWADDVHGLNYDYGNLEGRKGIRHTNTNRGESFYFKISKSYYLVSSETSYIFECFSPYHRQIEIIE